MINQARFWIVLAFTAGLCACKVYQTQGPAAATEAQDLTPVCHAGKQTVRVDDEGVRQHLGHGDKLGPCG